ncbi:metal ABC transporter ATP-binding protein [Sporosarcina sp. 179-K 3D1 HS]|uniref:metal ABC transporter ATP-binding protein n=1 Tax=Sporosarcina sp. 179-K 3D1 HS TaxID=3232169 RepID=UPI0039A1F530
MGNSLEVNNLSVSYYGNIALSNINFEIEIGRLVGVIGPNGAGKSTLIKAILGLLPKDRGEIKIKGKPIKEMRKNVAYVPQRSAIDWDFPITVKETVLIGTYPSVGMIKRPGKQEKDLAKACLEQVDMLAYEDRQIGELSGGQQQRVFLARALAQKAELFLLDEPFVGIDVTSEEMIIRILKELRDQGKTIVVVHHDLSKAEHYFDELILLNNELIASGPVKEVFTPKTIARAYGGQLSFLEGMVMSS